jgi:hypothetical protein
MSFALRRDHPCSGQLKPLEQRASSAAVCCDDPQQKSRCGFPINFAMRGRGSQSRTASRRVTEMFKKILFLPLELSLRTGSNPELIASTIARNTEVTGYRREYPSSIYSNSRMEERS